MLAGNPHGGEHLKDMLVGQILMVIFGISTAASIPSLTLPSGTGTRSAGANTAFGTHHEDISSWPTCSYTVVLTTRVAVGRILV